MKKALSMLLAIVMVLSMLTMSVFAASNPTISLETDFTPDLEVGDTFTVTANLAGNTRFDGLALSLKWNENAVRFTGFKKNGRVVASEVCDASLGYNAATVNDANGMFAALDTSGLGYDTNGMLFVANFEIVGDGALDIGFKTDSVEEFMMVANQNGQQIRLEPTLNLSAVQGLTVGGKPVGPEMPENAPFTAITTDAGPIVAIEQWDNLDVDPWGYGMGTPVVHYHITVSEDTTEAYVRFPLSVDNFVSQNFMIGENEIGSAYASVNHDDLDADAESGMAGLQYGENGDDYTVMIIPMEFAAGDMMGNVGTLPAVKGEDELYYAVGPQDPMGNTYALFSFEYDDGLEEYNISIDENMVGGTIYACDEDGNEITKAKVGETVFVEVEADEGYTTNGAYYINGQIANDFMFVMPEEDVILSATFTPVHTCSYTESVVDAQYLKSDATCQSGAVYYKSCTCGKFVTTADTFVSGETVDHVYENGVCKWCGAAEPVQASGYTFATSADVSAENGDTVVVYVKITGHSDPSVTSYNAYDLTLTFDSDKLEYQGYDGAVKSDNGSVTVEGNTIRIVGCGADKDFGTKIAALTFKTKAEGNANVTISKVQVSDKETAVDDNIPEATPKHDEDDTTADETPDVSVVIVPYGVGKPDFISGNDKVLHGETYTFSYTDTTNYTYSDLTVTVGGETVIPTEENGVYTITNVTGAVVISATQTPNTYNVTFDEKNTAIVTGNSTATYGTPYIFTVTPSKDDMAIDTVKVTLADGTEIPYTLNENGEYVIEGTNITGAFTITVTEKEKMTTVTFTGIKETEIDGGLTQTAEIGKDFTFQLIKEEGFDYTVKVDETELTESEETAGQYTIPAELVVKGGVQVDITKEDNTKPVVAVTEYISLDDKVMFLVTAKWGDKVLAYGEETMFWSSKYTVTGEEEAGAYCWLVVSTDEMNTVELVKAAAEAAIVEAAERATATEIKYNYDVNGTTKVDVNDAQLAYDMYNAAYMEFTGNLPMWKFLEADMETNGKLDTQDVAAIISYIVSGANA